MTTHRHWTTAADEAQQTARLIEQDEARRAGLVARSRARLERDAARRAEREAGEIAPGVLLLLFGCGGVALVAWFVASLLGSLAAVVPS